ATSGNDNLVKVWPLLDREMQTILTRSQAPGPDRLDRFRPTLTFRPDGQRLAMALGRDQESRKTFEVSVWKGGITPGQLLRGHTREIIALAYSLDGAVLASADESGAIKMWDAESGRELLAFSAHDGPVRALAFRPGRSWVLASGGDDKSVRLWE